MYGIKYKNIYTFDKGMHVKSKWLKLLQNRKSGMKEGKEMREILSSFIEFLNFAHECTCSITILT